MLDSAWAFARKHWEFVFGAVTASALIFGVQTMNSGPKTEEEIKAKIKFYEKELDEIKKANKKDK